SEKLSILLPNQPDRIYWRGAVASGDGFLPKNMPKALLDEPTIPSGHAEGLHDAFARLHRAFEADVRKWKSGRKFSADGSGYANLEDGVNGLAFIDTCLKSHAKNGKWIKMPKSV
ncbi:MAG: gfo/Idh/MocA family oxidoreductase, partial [Luteolibacter sp.]